VDGALCWYLCLGSINLLSVDDDELAAGRFRESSLNSYASTRLLLARVLYNALGGGMVNSGEVVLRHGGDLQVNGDVTNSGTTETNPVYMRAEGTETPGSSQQ
jgi:hypothetical protein